MLPSIAGERDLKATLLEKDQSAGNKRHGRHAFGMPAALLADPRAPLLAAKQSSKPVG
jgi:hypothetical protein